jgi:WD40 repeat protein
MDATERLFVVNAAKPQERMELACPAGLEWVSHALAVSPDDAWIACTGDRDQVVCFEVATKKATVLAITPKDGDTDKWSVFGFAFSRSGKLFACRHGNAEEVPKGKSEKDVPAERRGIVRIDLPDGKLVPLDMGHTRVTSACAIDRTETWLATVGSSRPDKPLKDVYAVDELRVYNLASGKLAYREQFAGGAGRLWFTPSGKRLVCVTNDGTVRWWDVPVR